MTYENFIFFQFYANKYGDAEVINLQRTLADNDGSAESLASVSGMAADFQEFLVDYLSIGIMDTGGGTIIVDHPAVTEIENIDQKGDKEFNVAAFVAARYGLKYKKEKRFLQKPEEDGDGKYSMAKSSERKNPGSWSGMPPELRSDCKDDLIYVLALTTAQPESDFTLKTSVTEVEKAECDPCLLGAWEIDQDSFNQYMKGVLASSGGIPDLPDGSEITFKVGGHYYLEFKQDRQLDSRRAGFTVTIEASNKITITTTIDSQGSGMYTTDGKVLQVNDLTDTVNNLEISMNGTPISPDQSPIVWSYDVLGDGEPISDSPQSRSVSYVCKEKTLRLTQSDNGEILLNRVVDILPTPVPTPGF